MQLFVNFRWEGKELLNLLLVKNWGVGNQYTKIVVMPCMCVCGFCFSIGPLDYFTVLESKISFFVWSCNYHRWVAFALLSFPLKFFQAHNLVLWCWNWYFEGNLSAKDIIPLFTRQKGLIPQCISKVKKKPPTFLIMM